MLEQEQTAQSTGLADPNQNGYDELITDSRTPELHEPSLREYELSIRFLSSGVVVSIGCKQIAFETIDKAMEEINAYIKNPKASYEKWNKIFIK